MLTDNASKIFYVGEGKKQGLHIQGTIQRVVTSIGESAN